MECFQGAVAIATVTKKTRFHNEVSRHLSPEETVLEQPLAQEQKTKNTFRVKNLSE
jgi:hypothetical protein